MTIPSITSLGIGAGLDANNIVAGLMAAERAPLNALNQREASFKARISAFGTLTNRFDALKTAAANLADPSRLSVANARADDPDIFSATTSFGASPGRYNVEVVQLAQAQKSFSGLYASGETFGAGTLTFDINGESREVAFAGGSLSELRAAINNANIGISATTIAGDAGERLVLTSRETGTNNAFTLSINPEADANLQSIASFDGANPFSQTAQNAQVRVEGELTTSQSNQLSSAIAGVSLNLNAVGTTSLEVTQSRDSIRDNVNEFVKAFNSAVNELKTLSAFNGENNRGGVLNGDGTVRSLRSLLSQSATGIPAELAGTQFESFSSLGIEFTRDGTLRLDETRLNRAIDTDFDASVTALSTLGAQVRDVAEQATGRDGLIRTRTDGLNDSVRRLEDQRTRLEFQLELTEKRFRAQFTALDRLMGELNATSAFLGQQLSGLAMINNSRS